jgi:hypothetical protein
MDLVIVRQKLDAFFGKECCGKCAEKEMPEQKAEKG